MNKTLRNILGGVVLLACVGAGGVWALNSNGLNLKPTARETRRDLTAMNSTQLRDFSKNTFVMTDRNGDGFIELDEAPKARATSKTNGVVTKTDSGPQVWMKSFDHNGDGKVSWNEYYDKVRFLAKNGKKRKPGDPDCPDCKPVV